MMGFNYIRLNNAVEISGPVYVNAYAIRPPYEPVKAVKMTNGCCEGKPVILTRNHVKYGGVNYSCQCSCGGWCTSGHATPDGALDEYYIMSRRAKR